MKTIVNGHKFDLSETSSVFLNKYLKKLGKFIEKNNIETDVYDDIEERIAEALSESLGDKKTKKISDTAVINIINELGEPDEIFVDIWVEDSEGSFSKNNFKKYLSDINFKQYFTATEQPLRKDSEHAILAWVCYGIATKYKLDPIWVRLAFILGTLMWGMTIILYIVLVVLLPDNHLKKKVSKNKSVKKVKAVAKQQVEKIKSMPLKQEIEEKVVYVKKTRIIPRFFNGIVSLIRGLFRFVFHFVRIILACALFLICLPILIAFLFTSGVMFSDIVVDNQIMFTQVDLWLKIGVVWLLFSLFFIIFGIFLKLLRGKTFATSLILSGIIAIFIFAFIWWTGFVKTLSEYQNIYTQSDVYELGSNTLRLDDISVFGNENSFIQWANWIDAINFERSNSLSLSVEVTSVINSSDQASADTIFTSMIPLVVTDESKLWLAESTFTQPVPYSFLRRELTYYIPEGVEVELGDSPSFGWYVSWLYYTSDDKSRKAYGFWKCRNTRLVYSEELEWFECVK